MQPGPSPLLRRHTEGSYLNDAVDARHGEPDDVDGVQQVDEAEPDGLYSSVHDAEARVVTFMHRVIRRALAEEGENQDGAPRQLVGDAGVGQRHAHGGQQQHAGLRVQPNRIFTKYTVGLINVTKSKDGDKHVNHCDTWSPYLW